jgi:pullulanase
MLPLPHSKPSRWLSLFRTVLLSVPLAAAASFAQSPADDCLSEQSTRLIHSASATAPKSTSATPQAIWFDAKTLRWPGQPVDGRYVLYFAARANLDIKIGERVAGADTSLALMPLEGLLDAGLATRFRHVGEGVTLSVDVRPQRLRTLLKGQLVLVREDEAGRALAATHTQHPGAIDQLYREALTVADLGVTFTSQSTRFALWAPTAVAVHVCVEPPLTALQPKSLPTPVDVFPAQEQAATGTWRLERGPLAFHHYRYLVDVYVPGVGIVRNRVTDPYALSLDADSKRALVVDLNDPRLKPPGWDRSTPGKRVQHATDMTIYELHVRDFSVGDRSVPVAHRGKYTAFRFRQSAGMRHLALLSRAGLTDVHLLPVFDIATIPEEGCTSPTIPTAAADSEAQQAAASLHRATDCFNWGYDPYHFTAPEGSYATNAMDGRQRIREFREMVMGLHSLGLRVGMDVVYNHTAQSGQNAKSVLDRIVPGYYHRRNANGAVEQSTCCENTATEHAMMAKLMIDSTVVWARDYRIDSFRFDLMGHQPRSVMEQLQAVVNRATGRDIHLLGEGWNFGEVANGQRFVQASQLSLNGSGIGTFSDRARDAIRGGTAMDSGRAVIERQGWVSGLGYAPNEGAIASGQLPARDDMLRTADWVRVGLAGSLRDYRKEVFTGATQPLSAIDYAGQPAGYVREPREVVNYVENHDNQTLFDILALKLPLTTTREDRARVQVLALALNTLSQGIAYYHAGGEILRSKSLDRNSYDSGDWFNRLDWTLTDNGFAAGLPPAEDNRDAWPLMRPFLQRTDIKPPRKEIQWTRDAFVDWLQIRASSALFRLPTAAAIRERLRFFNTGPTQNATLIVGHLNGQGLAQANFHEVMYLVNADLIEAQWVMAELKGQDWRLHPVLARPGAVDQRAKAAQFEKSAGQFTIPPRTAVVFVRNNKEVARVKR